MLGARDIEILLVEPDPAEGRRAAAIFKRSKVRNHVTAVTNSAEALAHLRREGSHYRSPRPNLILLNADGLPQRGEELLATIKCDTKFAHIPVVMLSSAGTDAEVARAYDLDANCCVQKPLNDEEMDRVLEIAREFWLTIVKLPSD
jgi:two-component system, chemotaxis family, response regulator Rcp1